jgi:hypothetical protein
MKLFALCLFSIPAVCEIPSFDRVQEPAQLLLLHSYAN